MVTAAEIQFHLDQAMNRIALAAKRAGRDPKDVKLVVVTKTHSIELVQASIHAGVRFFGENYTEEAIPKILASRERKDLRWHMIGHVQSRKAQAVCHYFDYLHSLDSLKLANRLSHFSSDREKPLPVLLECNTSGERSKYGLPVFNEGCWYELLPVISQITQLPGICVEGLMTMAPFGQDPEESRPFFNRLSRFSEYLQHNLPDANWSELSMGMSGDFEIAVEEGATWVRIGQLILGPRTNV